MKDDSLIIDAGMHTGRDTEFYLAQGFRVIAIEAHPDLIQSARSRFAEALSSEKLILYDVAIADHDGEAAFYINREHDDWGTLSEAFASRNERLGTTNTIVRVQCTRFASFLRRHAIPHYLKIDIEGADTLCLEALLEFPERPQYISIEAGLKSFEETFNELSLLWVLGYRRFKIVNQALFDGTSSGPFGEEAPGRWMSIEETFRKYRRLLREQKYFGAHGTFFRTPVHKLYELLKREPAGWYDFHATL